MKIEIKNGLIYSENKPLDVMMADRIARANKFAYAEQFIKLYDKKKLSLSDFTLKVQRKTKEIK